MFINVIVLFIVFALLLGFYYWQVGEFPKKRDYFYIFVCALILNNVLDINAKINILIKNQPIAVEAKSS